MTRVRAVPAVVRSAFLAALLLAAVSTHARAAPLAGEGTVEAAVGEFYRWYLHALAQNSDPLLDERATMSKYVSRALLGEIEKARGSADGLDEDYFIQAQDYLDDWEGHVAVAKPSIQGSRATAQVVLGATAETRSQLALRLVREDGAWKIRAIHRAR